MPSIVTGGLGWRLLSGGLGGTGLPTGSGSAVQNPGFEVAGSSPGIASNWTTDVVYTESEYATFTRPGLDVVTTSVPAQQPTLGFTIVHNIVEGTVTITQAANEGGAQEDFEEGWSNNEQFLLALPDANTSTSTFENQPYEPFESGWLNNPGLEKDFDSLSSANATFSYHLDPHSGVPSVWQVETFEGYWPPTSTTGLFVTAIPNVVFGTTTATAPMVAGSFFDGNRIIDVDPNGAKQYADCLLIRITVPTKTAFSISISYVDGVDAAQSVSVTIPQDLIVGAVIPVVTSTGVRDVQAFTPDGTYGYPGISIEGDPGVAFVAGTTAEIDSWVRAEFGVT
jgi:hypothetical protein